jgi:hypothetical protein
LYSYASQKVFSVDLSNGVVAGNATIPVTNQANFSGATTYVAGGIADGQRNLVWLATAEGLLGINPADLSATPIKIAQPPNTSINENLGGDPAHDLIFSPDYDNEGIVVFNLAERKAYAMSKATWQAMNGLTNQLIELDGAALDSAYQLAIITPEHGPLVGLMGYSTPSGSSDAVGTFATSKFKLYTLPAGSSFAGSAIDTVSHTALFVGEGDGFGVRVGAAQFPLLLRAARPSHRGCLQRRWQALWLPAAKQHGRHIGLQGRGAGFARAPGSARNQRHPQQRPFPGQQLGQAAVLLTRC